MKSGTSLGFLAALTANENADISTNGIESEVRVAPQSTWSVARVIQELDSQGSTVGAHFTLLHRSLKETDALASLLTAHHLAFDAMRIRHMQCGAQFLGMDNRRADLADNDAGSSIGKPRRLTQRATLRQCRRNRGDDGVAGAGHIKHFARLGC